MSAAPLVISFVIPCYEGGGVLPDALHSIFTAELPAGWQAEAVVVDDGSRGSDAIAEAVARAGPGVQLLRHKRNKGTAAARNTGLSRTMGDVVVMLDADDYLVPDWPPRMAAVLAEWPDHLPVCGTWCVTEDGELTVESPGFTGERALYDWLTGRHDGEYLPMFRGDYIRRRGYVDTGLRRGAELLTYLGMARDAPFWISSQVLRVYRRGHPASVTGGWMKPAAAAEMVELYTRLEDMYGDDYRRLAPLGLRQRQLRRAVYRRIAGQAGAWSDWGRAAHWALLRETLGAGLLLLLGRGFISRVMPWAKRLRAVRRYG